MVALPTIMAVPTCQSKMPWRNKAMVFWMMEYSFAKEIFCCLTFWVSCHLRSCSAWYLPLSICRNCMQYICVSPHTKKHAKRSLAQSHPMSWQMLFLSISSRKEKCLEGTDSHQGSLVQGHTQWALSITASGGTLIPQFLLLFMFLEQHHAQAVILPQRLASLLPLFCHFPILKQVARQCMELDRYLSLLLQEVSAPVAESTTLLCPLGKNMRNRKLISSNGW